jgi:PAS domain S-box-containing protein
MPLSAQLLQRFLEASPDIVVATDRHGTVSYYNDGARENLGYSRDEIIGRGVEHLYPSRDEARRVMAAMRSPEYGERGKVVNFPTTFVAKDNRRIAVAISGFILYDDSGEEEGTFGFAKDISEILRKDQIEVLGDIAIGFSHEISNPLQVILNHLGLLEKLLADRTGPGSSGDDLRHAEAIRREVERIQRQLGRLHEMAEHEQYMRTPYLGDATMIDLSPRDAAVRPLAGRCVLVVDDDAGVRESVAEILQGELCRVVPAADGRQALDALERQTFDLVLSDVVMPGMDGYQLYLETKRRWPQTVVVLMTAFYYDKDHVLKRSRLEGLPGVLFKKPVRPDRLKATLAALLRPLPPGAS